MTIQERINNAASSLPNEIAIIVLADVDKRISDWKASGGKDTDPYIEQQAKYVENMAKQYGVDSNE